MRTNRRLEDPDEPDAESTPGRQVVAAVLAVTMVPALGLGLLDPLEGGLALLVAIALAVAVRLLSGIPVPRLAWVPALVALGLAVAAVVAAVRAEPREDASGGVASSISGGRLVLVWSYELAALVTLVGGTVYAVRVIRSARTAPVSRPAPE